MTRRSITIEVVGTPIPGGNKTKMRWAMVEGADLPNTEGERNRCKNWKARVHEAALLAMGDAPPLDGPIELEMLFRLERKAGHYTPKGVLRKSAPAYPDTKPDLTKILRSTEDALVPVALANDSRVVRAQQSKDWCAPGERPGVTIVVTELTSFELRVTTTKAEPMSLFGANVLRRERTEAQA